MRVARLALRWAGYCIIRSDFFRQHNQSEDRLRLPLWAGKLYHDENHFKSCDAR